MKTLTKKEISDYGWIFRRDIHQNLYRRKVGVFTIDEKNDSLISRFVRGQSIGRESARFAGRKIYLLRENIFDTLPNALFFSTSILAIGESGFLPPKL